MHGASPRSSSNSRRTHDEVVTVRGEDVQVSTVALQIGPDLLGEQKVIRRDGPGRARSDGRTTPAPRRPQRPIDCLPPALQARNGDLCASLLPVGAAVLGDGEPAVDIENIGDLLDREQRPRQSTYCRVASSLRARATTLSTVKPYFSSSTVAGADAPKRSTPSTSPRVADVALPALRDAELDREARRHLRRQHLVAIALRLAPRTDPSSASRRSAPRRLRRSSRSAAATTRPTSEPVAIRISDGAPFGRVAQHVGAAAHAFGAREAAAVERRQVLAASAPAAPAGRAFRSPPSTRPRSRWRRPGAAASGRGIARRLASCSTGWCVGPSSPSARLSWVKTWTTCSPISAARRIGGRM